MCDAWTYEVTRAAQEKCYGQSVLPRYRFDRAEYVLVFDSDPLAHGYSQLEWAADFGKTKKLHKGADSKLVVFEPRMSVTGACADERYRVKPSDAVRIALSVARELVVIQGLTPKGTTKRDYESLARFVPVTVERSCRLAPGTIHAISKSLWENQERAIVVAGENPTLQIIANLLNSACSADGRTVDGSMSPSRQSRGGMPDLLDLISDMQGGKIDALIVHGTNPAYFLPAEAGWEDAVSKVKTVVSLQDRVDETARFAHYVLPSLHWLENWGDPEPQAGLFCLAQPAINPLFDNRAAENSLLSFARTAKSGLVGSSTGNWHDYLKQTWREQVYSPDRYPGDFEDFWTSALRSGVVNTVVETGGEPRKFDPDAVRGIGEPAPDSSGLELVVYPSPILGDGTHANNSWLLECPDPISKIAWTNYASISPALAKTLGVSDNNYVMLEAGGVKVETPVQVQPGMLDNVVAVASGWGRTHAGKYGNNVGVNAFGFRRMRQDRIESSGIPCTLTKTDKWKKIPLVQEYDFSQGRPIIADATYDECRRNPHAGQPPAANPPSMWSQHSYPLNRWGMTIDLSACIACQACVIACNVENNVPVVYDLQTMKGRYMHWIRIDRYYSGDPDNPDVNFQPMLCQHCENAPCETVCPVIATAHSSEGLNQQIYNRCVGTRYCSNNCPYKVRRFNWFEFSKNHYSRSPLNLGLNPDVTVREKGVMEKCTFCIQRITHGKRYAKALGREVKDGDIVPACQQTCPTNVITFGNYNDPDSQVSRNVKDQRSYRVLEDLNPVPRIFYWTHLRNRTASWKDEQTKAGKA
jgi:Fe-S-cluster-containing dehydrogenase component